ncbi:MAG TPA: protein kinase [Pirellulaceae bacterium]|nr:protein kinase [Pirellulaceae bacterium]
MTGDEPSDSLLDRIRAEQLRRWERGDRVLVEPLLREFVGSPDPSSVSSHEGPVVDDLPVEDLLDLIYGELLLREEAGEQVGVSEYVARFPHLERELRRQFDVHAALSSIESDVRAIGGGDDDESADDKAALDSPTPVPSPDAPTARLDASRPASTYPKVDDYEILGELGRGGMGIVYKARHRHLKRIVALKMIRDRALADATVLGRFRAEAEAVARLRHPHIVHIHDYGECEAAPYLALEYVDGGNLEPWTREPLHDSRDCATLVAILARAIGYAHQQGIVHRDLKPANILLTPLTSMADDANAGVADGRSFDESARRFMAKCGVPKITDFGLAKQYAAGSDLTHSAAILGTGAYMSPEQAWGHSRDVGPQTDVHSLGVILYELLTGRSPFRDETLIKTLDRVRFETPTPPSRWREEVPPELDRICARCLEKEPERRYTDGRALADDLDRFMAGTPLATESLVEPRPARRLATPLIGLALLLVAVAVGLALRGAGDRQSTSPEASGVAAGPSGGSSGDSGSTNGAGSTGSSPSNRTKPETFAFLVGVRSYRFPDGVLDLEYTESDVDELSRLLLRKGVPRRNIQLLTQWSEADNPELAPTARNIRSRLQSLLRNCIAGDTVIVAITGMGGESGPSGAYCYLPADVKLNRAESLITLNEFFSMFENCAADRKVLLVDTCQTAALPDYSIPTRDVPRGVAALFACSRGEASYEHAQLKHGVFSYHLLEGLQGAADSDGDGGVTLSELHAYTKGKVAAFVAEKFNSASQTPSLLTSLDQATTVLPAR